MENMNVAPINNNLFEIMTTNKKVSINLEKNTVKLFHETDPPRIIRNRLLESMSKYQNETFTKPHTPIKQHTDKYINKYNTNYTNANRSKLIDKMKIMSFTYK